MWEDERISLAQQGVTVWVRDEAMAGVQVCVFLYCMHACVSASLHLNTHTHAALDSHSYHPLCTCTHAQASMFTELPASKDTAIDSSTPQTQQDFAHFMKMQILSAKVRVLGCVRGRVVMIVHACLTCVAVQKKREERPCPSSQTQTHFAAYDLTGTIPICLT